MMVICIKPHLSSISSSIHEKVTQQWGRVEKSVVYKKACIIKVTGYSKDPINSLSINPLIIVIMIIIAMKWIIIKQYCEWFWFSLQVLNTNIFCILRKAQWSITLNTYLHLLCLEAQNYTTIEKIDSFRIHKFTDIWFRFCSTFHYFYLLIGTLCTLSFFSLGDRYPENQWRTFYTTN